MLHIYRNHYKRPVIGFAGNGGEYFGLGIDTMRLLFPDKDYFFAVNMRWNFALAIMLTAGQDTCETY